MVTFHTDYFDKCKRVNPISFTVEPEEACWTVVLNRWRKVCPSCFDQLAEQAGGRLSLTHDEVVSRPWLLDGETPGGMSGRPAIGA